MKPFLHLRVQIHRWVVWWIVIGVVCGVVAITNILERNLTPSQERILWIMGAANWILGGLICYACEGIQIEEVPHMPEKAKPELNPHRDDEWHSASDFLLPGSRKSLLPPRYR